MKIREIISGSLLIAGTTIGAGMLGIPLITSQSGFLPALGLTTLVWLFMYATGLLFLEATLWMHRGSNVLSMSKRFIGEKGRIFAGGTFVFLYYCLMVAYFAGGAPLMLSLMGIMITGWKGYALFGIIVTSVVAFGLKVIDRVNYLLMAGLVLSYLALIGSGVEVVNWQKLLAQNWSKAAFAGPILFAAFGYHNIIPSLTDHFQNGKVMRRAIFWGTFIPFIVYVLWQWLIIGAVPEEALSVTMQKGEPVTYALQALTSHLWVQRMGNLFAFFALITSLLGVAFSVVDFLGDGLKMRRTGLPRVVLCLLTFIPPFLITSLNPTIFVLAIGVAGGFGEAFLNGILPVWLVWKGRYRDKLDSEHRLFGGKATLTLLLLISFAVILLEAIELAKR